MLSHHRFNQERLPYLQTSSTRNHTVERLWPEINNRVNYPLKTALLQLTDQEAIDMEDNLVRYCVSNLTCQLCHIGLASVAESWNAHRIPGKGIPNHFAEPGCKRRISAELLPNALDAADLYRQHLGSALKQHSTFGVDPFTTEQDKLRTESNFAEKYPDIAHLFFRAVNGDFTPYKEALLYLINRTQKNV
uniref:Si:ch211-227p7.1 n=1 Tax=Iconisemion striatum TaxID=60296 RepID=A0A1A7XL76_9TELE